MTNPWCKGQMLWLSVFAVQLSFTTACSSGSSGSATNPTEDDASKIFSDRFASRFPEATKVEVELNKTNAISGDRLGLEFYELEYVVGFSYFSKSELVIDCRDNYASRKFVYNCAKAPYIKPGTDQYFSGGTGSVTFIKTENGWRGPDGKIY